MVLRRTFNTKIVAGFLIRFQPSGHPNLPMAFFSLPVCVHGLPHSRVSRRPLVTGHRSTRWMLALLPLTVLLAVTARSQPVTPAMLADEAFLFTPAGFAKEGKPVWASGADNARLIEASAGLRATSGEGRIVLSRL